MALSKIFLKNKWQDSLDQNYSPEYFQQLLKKLVPQVQAEKLLDAAKDDDVEKYLKQLSEKSNKSDHSSDRVFFVPFYSPDADTKTNRYGAAAISIEPGSGKANVLYTSDEKSVPDSFKKAIKGVFKNDVQPAYAGSKKIDAIDTGPATVQALTYLTDQSSKIFKNFSQAAEDLLIKQEKIKDYNPARQLQLDSLERAAETEAAKKTEQQKTNPAEAAKKTEQATVTQPPAPAAATQPAAKPQTAPAANKSASTSSEDLAAKKTNLAELEKENKEQTVGGAVGRGLAIGFVVFLVAVFTAGLGVALPLFFIGGILGGAGPSAYNYYQRTNLTKEINEAEKQAAKPTPAAPAAAPASAPTLDLPTISSNIKDMVLGKQTDDWEQRASKPATAALVR
jgi:hypothetical protein